MKIKLLIGIIILTILTAMNIAFIKLFPEYALFSWPVTLNCFAFFLYWFDKRQSIKNAIRTPNDIFYIIAITGGIIGSLMGVYCFRHKTKKILFVLNLWIILIAYIACFYIYYNYEYFKTYAVQFFETAVTYFFSFFDESKP